MAQNEAYIEYVLEQLNSVATVTTRKMFGLLALYADGPIFGIIDDGALYFKVDDTNRQQYLDEDGAAFMPGDDPFKPPLYYLVPARVLEDRDLLKAWMGASLEVAMRSASSR